MSNMFDKVGEENPRKYVEYAHRYGHMLDCDPANYAGPKHIPVADRPAAAAGIISGESDTLEEESTNGQHGPEGEIAANASDHDAQSDGSSVDEVSIKDEEDKESLGQTSWYPLRTYPSHDNSDADSFVELSPDDVKQEPVSDDDEDLFSADQSAYDSEDAEDDDRHRHPGSYMIDAYHNTEAYDAGRSRSPGSAGAESTWSPQEVSVPRLHEWLALVTGSPVFKAFPPSEGDDDRRLSGATAVGEPEDDVVASSESDSATLVEDEDEFASLQYHLSQYCEWIDVTVQDDLDGLEDDGQANYEWMGVRSLIP